MDDFGTGQSSLACVQQYPLDTIKIDRGFVKNLGRGGHHGAIIQAVTTLATSLGMKVVAEGVETASQLARVRALGCHSVQGFFFSPPVAREAFEALVADPASIRARLGLPKAA